MSIIPHDPQECLAATHVIATVGAGTSLRAHRDVGDETTCCSRTFGARRSTTSCFEHAPYPAKVQRTRTIALSTIRFQNEQIDRAKITHLGIVPVTRRDLECTQPHRRAGAAGKANPSQDGDAKPPASRRVGGSRVAEERRSRGASLIRERRRVLENAETLMEHSQANPEFALRG